MPTACAKQPRTSSATQEVAIKNPSFVPPASRSSWSGALKLGSITVPLKGYSAAVTQRDSPLHLVHLGCGSRIQQPRRCPKHGEIPSEQIVKAFEFAPDDDIVLNEGELNELKSTDDQVIHIKHLLPARRVDASLVSGRTLNLIPAHAAATDSYQLVVTALARTDEWGIGIMVMSERQQLIGLRVVDQRLVLHVLHWPALWRACPAFDAHKTPALADVERLSASLASLRMPFVWSDFRDEFDQKLAELMGRKLAARRRGKPTVVVKDEPPKSTPRRTATPRSGRAA